MLSDEELSRRLKGFAEVWKRVERSGNAVLPVQLMPRRQKKNTAEDHLPWTNSERRK